MFSTGVLSELMVYSSDRISLRGMNCFKFANGSLKVNGVLKESSDELDLDLLDNPR